MLRTAKDSRVITVKEEDFLNDDFDAVWKRVTSPTKIDPADIDEYFRWKTARDSKEDHFQ